LKARAEREKIYIEEVRQHHTSRMAVVAWRAQEPVGALALLELAKGAKE